MLFYLKFKSVKFNLKIIKKKSKKNQVILTHPDFSQHRLVTIPEASQKESLY